MQLEARNLTFSYKDDKRKTKDQEKKILDGFSMHVDQRERVGILAPSGFGKTTLCRLLAGYLEPDQGQVCLDGQALPTQGVCPVQMIWQHPELAVNPRIRMGQTLREGDRVEDRIPEELGIEKDWMNRYPFELSGGEIQRFCIARALGQSTRFLIADEITTMVDPITRSQIWNFLIREVESRGIGLVVVSHNIPLIERITTRIISFY